VKSTMTETVPSSGRGGLSQHGAQQHGVQQQTRAVSRCQLTYEAEHILGCFVIVGYKQHLPPSNSDSEDIPSKSL